MTVVRAILISDRREAIEVDRGRGPSIVARYDNAGDQPRIRWCVEHGGHRDHCMPICACGHWPAKHNFEDVQQCTDPGCKCSGWEPTQNACRVVSAIVVPVEEDA